MNRKTWNWIFVFFFSVAVLAHFAHFLKPGQSLYLARVDDPGPRFSYYPLMVESARQLRAGFFPLWTSKEGAGFPVLADYQSTPFNPFNLAFEIFPSFKFLDLMVVLKLILMGVFTYFFALELGLSPLSGACSAIIICFSGYVSKYLSQMNMNTELWLPAGLLIAEKMIKSRGALFHFLMLALVTALALVGGNPEAAFYFLFLILCYALIRGGWAAKKQILTICSGFILGFLVSSYQLLSFIDFLASGWHMHIASLHTIARPPVKWIFSLFFPWLFGPYRTHPAQLFLANYIGLVPAALALMTIFRSRGSNRARIFFWAYVLVFLAVVYQLPPIYYLTYLPVFNRMGNFKFAFFGVGFSIAMLAGYGCENYFSGRLKSRQLGIALALASVMAMLSLVLARQFPIAQFPVTWQRDAWLLPMLLFIIAAAIALYGIFAKERKLCAALLVFLSLINLLRFYPGLMPESNIDPAKLKFRNPSVPAFLSSMISDPDQPRFTGLEQVFHQNQSLIFGVSDWRVFEAVFPKSYVQVMGKIEGFTMEQSVAEFFNNGWSFNIRRENLNNPLVAELGIKYVLSPQQLNLEGWTDLARADGIYVARSEKSWPRTWLIQNHAPVFGKTKIKVDESERVVVSVAAGSASEMVLADQIVPGWRARALPDGREVKITPYHEIFRKVDLGLADHEVEYWYEPWGFKTGLFTSLCSLAVALFGLLAVYYRRKFKA